MKHIETLLIAWYDPMRAPISKRPLLRYALHEGRLFERFREVPEQLKPFHDLGRKDIPDRHVYKIVRTGNEVIESSASVDLVLRIPVHGHQRIMRREIDEVAEEQITDILFRDQRPRRVQMPGRARRVIPALD